MRKLASLIVLALTASACGDDSSSTIAAPSNLAGAMMSGGFHLTWTDNSSDEEEFIVERKPEGGGYVEQARVPFNTTQYMVESNPGGMQQFRVVARKGTETSSPSNEVMWMP